METSELEQELHGALVQDNELAALLAEGADSVYRMQAPGREIERYPFVVHTVISDIPSVSGDNVEMAHSVVMRLHIVTREGRFCAIYAALNRIMYGLGYWRIQTTPYVEDGEKTLISDYRIGVMANGNGWT